MTRDPDLDLVTVSDAQRPLVTLLEETGYETVHVSAGYSNHSHSDPDWGEVDVVYVDEATARQLFGAAESQLRLGGREYRVPTAEHLIAMKVQAMRNDPTRQIQDLADVDYLLRLPGTDRDAVRSYFERAGMLDWYERLVATL